MKLLAQLPTPTIATRTFSSSRPTPFVWPLAPLLSLMELEVLLDCWVAEHTWRLRWLHVPRAATVVLDAGDLAGKLVSHMPYPLEGGENRQCRDHVDRRGQQFEVAQTGPPGEDQADRKYHHADRPRRNSDLALDPERLGPGAGVGDHQRAEHRDHAHRRGEVAPFGGEVAGDGSEHDPLLDPVEGRVEEGAEEGPLARHPRVATVERVHHRAEDEGDAGKEEEALRHQCGGDRVAGRPPRRDRVGGGAGLDQPAARIRPRPLPVAGAGTTAPPGGPRGAHPLGGYSPSPSRGGGAPQ